MLDQTTRRLPGILRTGAEHILAYSHFGQLRERTETLEHAVIGHGEEENIACSERHQCGRLPEMFQRQDFGYSVCNFWIRNPELLSFHRFTET